MTRLEDQVHVAMLRTQQARGFRLLRFQPVLEAPFHDYYRESGRRFRLTLLCLGFVMVSATPFYNELLQAPESFRRLTTPLLYGVQLPALAVGIAVTAVPRWRGHADAILVGASLVLVGGVLLERAVGTAYGFDIPLEFIGVIIVSLFFVARLRFRTFFPAALVMTVIMIVNEAMLVVPQPEGWYRLLAMLILIAVAFVGGYSQEYLTRAAWLEHGILEHLSTHDGLTGLLNHRASEEAVERSLRQATRESVRVGVVLIDLDYFKRYNDEYGHARGDQLLRRLSDLLQSAARRPLDCVGRLGGEEFVIAWYDIEPGEIEKRVEGLRCALENGNIAGGEAHGVTMSMGLVTLRPDRNTRLQTVLNAADRLLYRAKREGRNRMAARHWPGAIRETG